MTDRQISITLATVTAIIAGFIISFAVARANQPNPLKAVEAVCDYSRTVQSSEWEEACGQTQDAAKATYKCESIKVDAKCKVEAK